MSIHEIIARIGLMSLLAGMLLYYLKVKNLFVVIPENFSLALCVIGLITVIFINIDTLSEIVRWAWGLFK